MRFDTEGFRVAIKRTRENLEFSLRETSEQTGISASTISRIENGMQPDMETFVKLCDWLSIHPGNFFIADVEFTPQEAKFHHLTNMKISNAIAELHGAIHALEWLQKPFEEVEG